MTDTDFHWDMHEIQHASTPVLHGRKILLGVTGGIACYKSLELARLLIKAGAQIRVVMTRGALAFLQPLVFQALTGTEPHVDLLDATAEAGMGHIELAKWADVVVVTPCSANKLARFAQGFADDLLETLLLATPAPVILTPAMNQQMWRHPATVRNITQLRADNITIIEPAVGIQACGDHGPGRALEPADLLEHITSALTAKTLQGLHVVVTAGPTREAIDPVRFLSNHSSGLMGYALAKAAARAGARVTLISGPSQCDWPLGVEGRKVESADEMRAACLALDQVDIFIGAAAVADFKPTQSASQKLGKDALQTIALQENPDIIAQFAQAYPDSLVVGFAAQTHNIEELARQKMQRKHLAMICANDVSDPLIGFNAPQNTVRVFVRQAPDVIVLGPLPKIQLAQAILNAISQAINL